MKEMIKKIMNVLFLLFALPLFILYQIESLLIGKEKSFPGISQFLSLFAGLSGVYLRRAFYNLSFKKCSWDCYIGFGTIFSHPAAEIARHVYIGTNCTIGDVSMADYATIGSNVDIMNRGKQHYSDDVNAPIQEQAGEYPKIFIGEDAWIGNSAVVMANIGKKAIIGAASVVVKDIEDYAIAVGNPAQVIRKRA
jgi:acetyltransferase-like isoleucine patch superfamily enzyme